MWRSIWSDCLLNVLLLFIVRVIISNSNYRAHFVSCVYEMSVCDVYMCGL